MAEQRRCEPRGDGARGRLGGGRLGALGTIALLLLAGCSADTLEPRPDDLGNPQRGTSGGGTTGTIVGAWRNVVVIQVPGDIQTWTTTWRFDAEGTCRQTVVTESLAEGFPRTTERTCTFTTSSTKITIAYTAGGVLTFDFTLSGPASDVLVLDGFAYDRIG